MTDTARYVIPRRLHDPERWLFWTVDEAAALMGSALPELTANQFVPGLIRYARANVDDWLMSCQRSSTSDLGPSAGGKA